MPRNCVGVVTALMGFRAVVCALVRGGCGVHWTDTMGARVYDHCGAVTRWCVALNEDIPVQLEAEAWEVEAWEVAVAWSRLLWTSDPPALTINRRAGPAATFL